MVFVPGFVSLTIHVFFKLFVCVCTCAWVGLCVCTCVCVSPQITQCEIHTRMLSLSPCTRGCVSVARICVRVCQRVIASFSGNLVNTCKCHIECTRSLSGLLGASRVFSCSHARSLCALTRQAQWACRQDCNSTRSKLRTRARTHTHYTHTHTCDIDHSVPLTQLWRPASALLHATHVVVLHARKETWGDAWRWMDGATFLLMYGCMHRSRHVCTHVHVPCTCANLCSMFAHTMTLMQHYERVRECPWCKCMGARARSGARAEWANENIPIYDLRLAR